MNTFKQPAIFVALTALAPLAVQAEMVELSDAGCAPFKVRARSPD